MVINQQGYEVVADHGEDITVDLDILELSTDDDVNRQIKKHSLEWPEEATIEEIDFSISKFGVQVHNLPVAFLTRKNAEKIASVFLNLIDLDFNDTESVMWNGIIRMKVALKVKDETCTSHVKIKEVRDKEPGQSSKVASENLGRSLSEPEELSTGEDKSSHI
ncbi:hypothetical protein REPUB_Repub18cG0082200 [Reevesia pubescens]